jgi:hypothetical protein
MMQLHPQCRAFNQRRHEHSRLPVALHDGMAAVVLQPNVVTKGDVVRRCTTSEASVMYFESS